MRYQLLAAVAALAVAGSAQAATTTYTGSDNGIGPGGPFANSATAEIAFKGAASAFGGLVTETFEGLANGNGPYSLAGGASASITGNNFGPNFTGINSTTLGVVYGFNTTSGGSKWLGFPVGTATINFGGGGTNGFGFYLTGLQTVFGASITLTQLDGSQQVFNIAKNINGGAQYFGIVDSTKFTSVSISAVGDNDAWGIDDLTYNSGVVPEPASWAMLIAGFGLVGAAQRRRQRTVTA